MNTLTNIFNLNNPLDSNGLALASTADGVAARTGTSNSSKSHKEKQEQKEEATEQQLMLSRLLDDLRKTLAEIGAAIDATLQIKDLIKKKKFDASEPEHFHLLITAGIDPETVSNEALTEEFLDEHEDKLRETAEDYKKSIEQAETLDIDDPEFYKKIENIQEVGVRNNKQEAYHSVVYASEKDPYSALAATGLSKDQQDDFINESFDDDFGDDFSTERPSITASSDVYENDFANAPDVQTAFSVAATSESIPQEPAQSPEKPAVVSTVSIVDPLKLG